MKVGIVAGEASGDLLGSLLIKALGEHYPDLEFVGIAGPRMQACGAQSWFAMEKLAVRGYVEVLRHFREILGIRSALAKRLISERPALFIGIDAPDFNLGLETLLKRAGIPTVHYVSPSLWAWRGERIHAVKRAVDRMLTVFPFEAALYERAGVPVSYVGHPLADAIPLAPQKDDARAQLRLKPDDLYIALLPGSRQTELDYHADLFVDTAQALSALLPEARFLVPLATRETRAQFDAARYRRKCEHLPLQILFGHSQLALAAADVALVASGTATLEAALLRCPHVVTYRMSPITWILMRRKAYLPFVSLPNILAGEFVVPEILQDDADAANLARAMVNLLRHEAMRKKMLDKFDQIHSELRQDNPERLRTALLPYLKRPNASNHSRHDEKLFAALRSG
jgi:lipid-A-disaccharide synthase